MTNARLFWIVCLTAVVSGTWVAGLTLARPALGDTPRTAVCTYELPTQKGDKRGTAVARWVAEQVAAGRVNLIVIPEPAVPMLRGNLCAW